MSIPKALEAALQGRTSFAIAHRLSTIQGREILSQEIFGGSVKKTLKGDEGRFCWDVLALGKLIDGWVVVLGGQEVI